MDILEDNIRWGAMGRRGYTTMVGMLCMGIRKVILELMVLHEGSMLAIRLNLGRGLGGRRRLKEHWRHEVWTRLRWEFRGCS